MILRQIPMPSEKPWLIMVDSNTSIILHKSGFIPKYISPNGSYIFYVKNNMLIKFMQDNNLQEIK